jgi:transcriptional regulator with XRE-family HTH domain
LGLTQQAFAQKMGVAITTIARYETGRPPRGSTLEIFAKLAEESGRSDLAGIFKHLLMLDLGLALGTEFRRALRDYRKSFSVDEMARLEALLATTLLKIKMIQPCLSGEFALIGSEIQQHLGEISEMVARVMNQSPSVLPDQAEGVE